MGWKDMFRDWVFEIDLQGFGYYFLYFLCLWLYPNIFGYNMPSEDVWLFGAGAG